MTKRTDSPWVDEAEAATLCGMTDERFRKHVPIMERDGFPKVSHWNGKRFKPAILAWWYKELGHEDLLPHPQDGSLVAEKQRGKFF